MSVITNVNIILPDRIIERGTVVFDESIKKILKVRSGKEYNDNDMIDGKGGYLAPGFIDIHIHGREGKGTIDGDSQALKTISESIVESGVTSFLPTTKTLPEKELIKALENIKRNKNKEFNGAQILGVNVEGPFLNEDKKGAQLADSIQDPNLYLLNNYEDIIKIVTVAPEKPGAEKFIKAMTARGIITSVGHSTATYEQVNEARGWGLSHATHLFNGMVGLHHRRPGTVGAALTSNMTCELIADLVHINPSVLKLVMQIKEPEEIILITDSVKVAGLGEGEYTRVDGQKTILKDGEIRLASGSLAGSVLTLDKAVKNVFNVSNLPLYNIINMVSLNPARLLDLDYKLGKIEKGYDADLTLMNDKLEVEKVYIKGKRKY